MITAIQNLAITCRKVREELTDVYFFSIIPRTRLHFGMVYPPLSVRIYNRYRGPTEHAPKLTPHALPNYAMFEVLQSSSLFTDYIQHVSICWTGCLCFDRSKYQPPMQPHVLEWLTKLKRLKTVGVLSTNGCTYCDKCLPKLLRLSRTLEKVVIWTLFEDDDEAIEYDEEQIKSYWMLRAGALALMAAEEEMKEIGESTVPLARYEALLPAIEEELIHERKESVVYGAEYRIGDFSE
ncbi:hypothetical protein SMACR_08897 [Sordaria macrospora]|uniref:WGS project CABT00000000 data, contig 2.68 n=2 Tax=Sordaria macrospora TaxID=5147 RepID=F7WB15_SORMK|nr:uncharacterized protein SMAC_08897 [Sordaria macrospora k-hell]KAA8636595.1 hypothetical protein SMACR_08897 [Sordaria macrospora]KAH7631982.1 hypothetical protein B0T09DRAFT_397537 [Sordaria sp. MPI-SDFR-AT-0083]WPJ63285.1 hypothetical protein SMAC4_08897 [Sordaria macrospora]CCC05403.1 unnamed protein product [Sordaria macrospora k-hell]